MFKCEHCGTGFSVKSSLTNHRKTAKYCLQSQGVESEVTATCEYCQKVYATVHNLTEHLRTCPMKRAKEVENHYKSLMEEQSGKLDEAKNLVLNLQQKVVELEEKVKTQELEFQKKYYEALLQERDMRIEKSEKEREKYMDDITDIARQTKTKTNNITINNTATLDLQDTSHIREILERHMDMNVLALGQKGVARMLKDTLLTDENGLKRYRCTDTNRGNFEYTDPNGQVERDPKAAKLATALVKSEIRGIAYDRGDKYWKNTDGSTDQTKFNVMSEKVQEVAELQTDSSKLRTELSMLMS